MGIILFKIKVSLNLKNQLPPAAPHAPVGLLLKNMQTAYLLPAILAVHFFCSCFSLYGKTTN